MATFPLSGGAQFPDGTSVSVYPRTAWSAEDLSGAPSGSAAGNSPQTITGGSATFTGLADATDYVAYANVGGQNRYRRFTTRVDALQSAGGGPSAATDAAYQPQAPALVLPALLDNASVPGSATATANQMRIVRAVMPRTGQLRDLAVFVATASGNLLGVVYDTGDAVAGSRTKLFDSGSVAAVAGWQIIGDPNLAVTRGQQLELGVLIDNATVSLGRVALTASSMQLPNAFVIAPGGALPKLAAFNNLASFVAPNTMSEASCQAGLSNVPVLIARIS